MRSLNIISAGRLALGLCLMVVAGLVPANAQPIARLIIQGVSPRDVAADPNDVFDEASSGSHVVGTGVKVYLKGEPIGAPATVGEWAWALVSRPSGSSAGLSAAAGELVTLRPDLAGVYVVRLTPLDANLQPTASVERRVIASRYAGVGVLQTNSPPTPRAPQCGASYCHGDNSGTERLRKVTPWLQSSHAQKLQLHMNGHYGAYYPTSCLSCHTVGFNTDPAANNGGFDDVAASINYPLSTITDLVADAVNNNRQNFPQLPAQLQNMASIQCESCHGPGTYHVSHLTDPDKGISGVNLGADQCLQCHSTGTGRQQIGWQWAGSAHVNADKATPTVATTGSCLRCHTGEGFVQQTRGQAPTAVADPHAVTCSTCHDPHFSGNPHQLRVAGPVTIDSSHIFAQPGMGGTCMQCHQSRVVNLTETVHNSFRGAHYGPQTDMLMGVNGWDFGLPLAANSAHDRVVADTCVSCHMAAPTHSGSGVTEPPRVGGHTFALRDAEVENVGNACASCHETLETIDRRARGDYDGDGVREGIQTEIRGLLAILQPLIAALPGVTYSSSSGTFSTNATAFANLSDNQKRALYNFNFVVKDGSYGIHNASYAVQLLQRSYYPLTQRNIAEDFPLMRLRGAVQRNHVDGVSWAVYE